MLEDIPLVQYLQDASCGSEDWKFPCLIFIKRCLPSSMLFDICHHPWPLRHDLWFLVMFWMVWYSIIKITHFCWPRKFGIPWKVFQAAGCHWGWQLDPLRYQLLEWKASGVQAWHKWGHLLLWVLDPLSCVSTVDIFISYVVVGIRCDIDAKHSSLYAWSSLWGTRILLGTKCSGFTVSADQLFCSLLLDWFICPK